MANYPNYYPQQLPWTQQNWYGQQVQQMQQPQQLTGRMVTSREEALGVPADFQAPVVMPDLAHGVVYVKVLNQQTGAADFLEYRRAEPQQAQNPVSMLEERVNRLESAVRGMMSKEKEAGDNV